MEATSVKIRFSDWVEKYNPTKNKTGMGIVFCGFVFETFGKDLHIVQRHSSKYVWTLVEAAGVMEIIPGYNIVNRIGYFICNIPWSDENVYVGF